MKIYISDENRIQITDERNGDVFSPFPFLCPDDSKNVADFITWKAVGDGLQFSLLHNQNSDIYGIVLPFDFMGKRDGHGKIRYLLNSVRHDRDSGVFYAYLTRADGKNLLLCAKDIAGWKIDYSEYDYGHYFEAIRLYCTMPEIYGVFPAADTLTFSLFPVSDFDSCLKIMSDYFGLPFIGGDTLSGKIGEVLKLKIYGECDFFETEFNNRTKTVAAQENYRIINDGITKITPLCGKKRGAAVTVLGVFDTVELYKKAMSAFSFETLSKTDGNLCEHQCWMPAMLRFLIKFSDRLTDTEIDDFEKKLKKGLSAVTAENPADFIKERTLLPFDFNGFPKYHIYSDSDRIQEQFFGVTVMLDAFRYFEDEKYLRYAVGAMDCLLDEHFDGGMLFRKCGDEKSDVTSVCCPMIPLCDMANFLRDKDAVRSKRYYAAAVEMAEFLFRRGFDFPTEGESSSENFKAEDGSVSCTALALLYYIKNVRYDERYLTFAKKILDFHDTSWVINTPLCETLGSTLRWWETLWEGDGDGPAICAGHAWTVWRAEADLLYYLITGDEKYKIKAKNGFAVNMAKIDRDGRSYAITVIDEICGGGFDRQPMKALCAPRKPAAGDCGLSNYLWVRLAEYLS